MIGETIGNFRIVTELGAGAMGEVYYAEHGVMGRRAAIKVIREELSRDEHMIRRFVDEARAVNAIRHPNIVEITDLGRWRDRYYIVMEMLEGQTLEERLDQGPLSPAEAVRVGAQVAGALGAAHARGVVHRDLKPENVFLCRDDADGVRVKVLDFGIAKLQREGDMPHSTQPGVIVGTPHYMSPEQWQGTDVGPPSDIYSLGVLLYQAVTGTLPFEADSLHALLFAHREKPPAPPRDRRPDLPAWLDGLIVRALEKEPQARFATMEDLRRALETRAPTALVNPAAPSVTGLAPAEPEPEPPLEEVQTRRLGGKLADIVLGRVRSGRLRLPAMPEGTARCLELLAASEPDFAEVAAALGRDPLLTPQILRVANSPTFGGATRVRTLEQAVARIGVRQLRTHLVEVAGVRMFRSRNPRIRAAFRNLWEHSLSVARLSQATAERVRLDPELAYLSGLLHDAGKPIAGALLLEAERLLSADEREWMSSGSWLDVVEACHREIGVALARSWGLPDEVARCISRCGRPSEADPKSVSNVVCFADALATREGCPAVAGDPVDVVALERTQQLLGLEPEPVAVLAATVGKRRGRRGHGPTTALERPKPNAPPSQ